ncbi:heavy metal translocating P-type ATPase [Gemella massiliensis]|uniref:heavy metal translocating P-type ATPase n=1 Tax=Gemella massiliensis TaxID=1909670 RepID=UPI000AA304B7|nr:heavy metal translocating P-type ATPase [Gemella massiliensis]
MKKERDIIKFLISYNVLRFVVGILIFITAGLFSNNNYSLLLLLLVYFILGYDVLYKSIKNIIKGNFFDENFLMAIATIGGIYIGVYSEAVAVMLFYQLGEIFADYASEQSRNSIKSLLKLRPDITNFKKKNGVVPVKPEDIKIGDVIVIKAGEKIALDGIVVSGSSNVDTSFLTGESIPCSVKENDKVLAGYVNYHGVIEVKVINTFQNSSIMKILKLVEEAANKKAPSEKFITKFSKIYTPLVVIGALLLIVIPLLILENFNIDTWLYRACMFLVISCPCALVVSIPTTYFSGLGLASKEGVLVKGSNYLDLLTKIETVVMDKTGTITEGVFSVVAITVKNTTKEELLKLAVAGEYYSNHPIAVSIKNYTTLKINEDLIKDYTELSGYGVSLSYNGDNILVGNDKLMIKNKIVFEKNNSLGTIVYIAKNNEFIGSIVIADKIKADTKKFIDSLKDKKIKTIMLTGDNKILAENVSKQLNIDEVYAELLPQNKLEIFEKIKINNRKKVMFIGDGINDTPTLARADIGVSMGSLGSDAAVETSDVVLMEDKPSKIITAINIAKKTRHIAYQNIIAIILVKVIFLTLGAFGIATMWEAIISDVGMTVIALLNSFRLLIKK